MMIGSLDAVRNLGYRKILDLTQVEQCFVIREAKFRY